MKPTKENRKKFDIDLEYGEIREDKIKDMLPVDPRIKYMTLPGDKRYSIADLRNHCIDNCKCGRKGKYFTVLNRVPDAELRGCSNVN